MIESSDLENRKVDTARIKPKDRLREFEERLHSADDLKSAAPRSLADRLNEARTVLPAGHVPCLDCWTRGRNDAVRAVDEGRLEEAHALTLPPRYDYHAGVYTHGRDAALRVIDGA